MIFEAQGSLAALADSGKIFQCVRQQKKAPEYIEA